MNQPLSIECQVDFQGRGQRGRRCLRPAQPSASNPCVPGRVPRVARLMALALRFEEQVRSGTIANYAELAELGHVTRARISQIMNLVNLAPDIQEALLFLPRTERGRDPIHLRQLLPIASTIDWQKQRVLWKRLAVCEHSG
jgi:hypothetical protein